MIEAEADMSKVPGDKLLWRLRYFWSRRDVARAFGVTEERVRYWTHRALARRDAGLPPHVNDMPWQGPAIRVCDIVGDDAVYSWSRDPARWCGKPGKRDRGVWP